MNRWLLRFALLGLAWPVLGAPEPGMRLVCGFETADELAAVQAAMAQGGENVRLELTRNAGVTGGESALKVTALKGAEWASLVLPKSMLADWDKAEAVVADVYTEDSAKIGLRFELWDAGSVNNATRCTLWSAEIAKGKQTFRWDITQCRRNAKETSPWESLDEADRIDMASLTKVKLFLTPPKDRDYVFCVDGIRLALKSQSQLDEEKAAAGAAQNRKVLFTSDFDGGKGLGGEGIPFKGNWRGLGDHETLVLEAPRGSGNRSKLACTVHAKKAKGSSACELPLHNTEIEPRGWDGSVSVKVYNAGFEQFYLQYLPIWPSDVTFHRAYFSAPKGEWTEIVMPFDKFLFQGRRPRRACEAEYFGIVGVGPESDDSVFQFDDFTVYRTRRTDLSAPKPKPALEEGTVYRQDFNDPADFDVESYYPVNKQSNIFRVAGGLDANGKPVDAGAGGDAGCLKLEGYQRSGDCRGGRRGFNLPGGQYTIEFDCILHGIKEPGLGARGKNGRYTLPLSVVPEREKWTHVSMTTADFTPVTAKDDVLWEITFTGKADGSAENYMLIDNFVIRRTPAPQATK